MCYSAATRLNVIAFCPRHRIDIPRPTTERLFILCERWLNHELCVACANNVYLLCNKAIICRRISNLVYCNIIFHLMQTFFLSHFFFFHFYLFWFFVDGVDCAERIRAMHWQFSVRFFQWNCLAVNNIIGVRGRETACCYCAKRTTRVSHRKLCAWAKCARTRCTVLFRENIFHVNVQ